MGDVIEFRVKKDPNIDPNFVKIWREDDGQLKASIDWSVFEDMVMDEIFNVYGQELANTPVIGIDFGLSIDDFDAIEFDLLEDSDAQ